LIQAFFAITAVHIADPLHSSADPISLYTHIMRSKALIPAQAAAIRNVNLALMKPKIRDSNARQEPT
jgi:hypothetical protein